MRKRYALVVHGFNSKFRFLLIQRQEVKERGIERSSEISLMPTTPFFISKWIHFSLAKNMKYDDQDNIKYASRLQTMILCYSSRENNLRKLRNH